MLGALVGVICLLMAAAYIRRQVQRRKLLGTTTGADGVVITPEMAKQVSTASAGVSSTSSYVCPPPPQLDNVEAEDRELASRMAGFKVGTYLKVSSVPGPGASLAFLLPFLAHTFLSDGTFKSLFPHFLVIVARFHGNTRSQTRMRRSSRPAAL